MTPARPGVTAFLFPGQGAQEVGMASELFPVSPGFERLVDLAGRRVGADLRRICLRGPERELVRTEYLQPLLVAVSLGYWGELIRTVGPRPDLVLGHSLGEVSALASAGVLSVEEAVAVAVERGRLMGAAAAKSTGGLMAVLADDWPPVFEALSDLLAGGAVFEANDNAPNQRVFAGTPSGLAEAARRLAAAKVAACRKLSVAGPWHSPLLREAQEGFAAFLATVDFRPARVPIVMNVSAEPESDPARIRGLLARNLTEPARWRTCMERLKRAGVDQLIEIGPGRVLSGLARANGLGAGVRVLQLNHLRALDLLKEPPSPENRALS